VNPRLRVLLVGLGKLKKLNDLIGTQTQDLLACSIAPEPSRLLYAPQAVEYLAFFIFKERNVIFFMSSQYCGKRYPNMKMSVYIILPKLSA
jgi:hypothetical protein